MDTPYAMQGTYLTSSKQYAICQQHIKSFFTALLLLSILFLQFCATNESLVRSLSNDITTTGFLNDDCYQCTVTAKPDAGVEGLVAGRESAHINLIQSMEPQCYTELFAAAKQLNPSAFGDSSMQSCITQQLKPYVDKRILIATYFNEDYSETAVIRIYENGLKKKLASLRCQ